jgi:anhydro-N-acetylmuramic acid kinase
MSELYIGLMSGTSLDGVDGVLIELNHLDDPSQWRAIGHRHQQFPSSLTSTMLSLNTSGGDELHRAGLAGNALAELYAAVVNELLKDAGLVPGAIRAIGAHGQTVRHRPGAFDGVGYTVQINNPARLAELTGIDIVADFRNRDVAAGGQGAPLVPAFHRAAFGRADETVVVLNLGGISNISVLEASGSTIGFDCGPGNVLMDMWCGRHLGQPYDAGGSWAASGHVNEPLLASLQTEPYFDAPAPKSTGRDLFNATWLDRHLSGVAPAGAIAPEDVQATLAQLTAWACAQGIHSDAGDADTVLVCGGGARNDWLMSLLQKAMPGAGVTTTLARGVSPETVEAAAFAWLAKAWIDRRPANVPAVTGAVGPRMLGALYPAV